jgi:DNA-binding CsgD family transcriptional regulator
VSHTKPVLAGRDEALEALEAAAGEALDGHGRLVLLEGAAGVGKTALVRHFLHGRGQAFRTLRSAGERGEAAVAGGVLGLLPGAGATELGAALRELAAASPVLLVVEDAQWVDAESLAALIYALRRMGRERILVIVSARPSARLDGLRRVAEGPAGRRVALTPLTVEALQTLAGALTPGAVRRLREHTGGNLRQLLALLDELGADVLQDFETPLPAPAWLVQEVAERIEDCPEPAVALVQAAAVAGDGSALVGVAELAGVPDALEALEAAVEAGILRAGRRRGLPVVEFATPSAAAAVAQLLGPATAARLHREAARLEADEVRALLHLAAASPGPDELLADQLDACARRCRSRSVAASALLTASRLSTTPARAENRLVRAVDWMLLAGEAARAACHTAQVAACAPGARRDSVLGQLAIVADRVEGAEAWLDSAWRRVDPEAEPELAAVIAHRNAFHALIHLRDEDAVDWAERALALSSDDELSVEWRATLALALWRLRRRDEAFAAIAGEEPQLAGMRAWLRLAGDQVEEAREPLARAAAAELRMGAKEIAVVHLNVLVRAHFAVGAWDEAAAVAEQAVALASELEDVSARVFVWWAAVLVPAARGEWATAERVVARAALEPVDAPDRELAVAMARALLASARADHAAVLHAFAPVQAILTARGDAGVPALDDPGFWPWQHLYGQALVAEGRLDAADALLARHEPLAAGHPTATARLALVRARLELARGRRAPAEAAFSRALAQLEDVRRPFARAQAQLALGQFLRRDGRRRSAVAHLTAAAETFAALGAHPSHERTQRELGASGLKRTPRGSDPATLLTPQELTVARLVAEGRSNRDVAADLQLSVKTVEVHLTRIYAKLGIGSRTQLAHLVP